MYSYQDTLEEARRIRRGPVDAQHRWSERVNGIQLTRQAWEARLSIFIQRADAYTDAVTREIAGVGTQTRAWMDETRAWLLRENAYLARLSHRA